MSGQVVERTVAVGHEEGIHARPASVFVQTAKQFASEIRVNKGEKTANAKSPLSVMALGARKGEEVTIHAEGSDAEAAVSALCEVAAGKLTVGQ